MKKTLRFSNPCSAPKTYTNEFASSTDGCKKRKIPYGYYGYKTPYVVTKRQWERHRATDEAEEAAKATSSAGKSRSRSRTRSRGRSRSRSRTPDPEKQRRMCSRTPRRIATRDTETTEKVSWADAVTGKRAPTAKAGDKTPAKTETEIAKLAQAIQALQKQIEHMQTQIRAKDELIEQLQHAVKSGTDTEAMQETQEELIEDDEVECPDAERRPTPTETTQETQEEPIEDDEVEFPDTKRTPTPTLTEATRRKRTHAAIRDARIDALEARLSNLEETIIASITRTIQESLESLESVHLRLSRLEATNSTIVPSHRGAAQHM
ncbi:serine/arginine-rich splicing factor 11-like [Dermacentor silvarum]|uniref:serine/arginine-rich splicing factor 11-like n=1 Tax=Dermacentor silvarum TaxID=543639 RepID=UPI002100C12E|nr:serine/arginine-rich splicing factor 11-like [Dermacentor silvarum]